MSARTWRCAIVGCGRAGEAHARALHRLDHARLVAACDHDIQRARSLGAAAYGSLDEMLDRERPDVLIVATPNGDHLHDARVAFARGVHAIVDKPLALSLGDVEAMIAAARSASVRLAGVYQTRWSASAQAAKAAVDEDRLGALVWLGATVVWHRDATYYAGWRGDPRRSGGTTITTATHSLDLMQWLAGPVRAVTAFAGNRAHDGVAVEDTLTAALAFAGGAHGSLVATTAAHAGRPARLELVGARGGAIVGGEPRVDADRELAANLAHVLARWADDRDADTDGPECRKSVQLALALAESAAQDGAAIKLLA